MENIIIEQVASVLAQLAITLIGVFGAWLLARLNKQTQLQNVAKATDVLITAAQTTVLELQQTFVEGWKAQNKDGKLTPDQIKDLGTMLLVGTKEKMAPSVMKLLEAAGTDVDAIIKGAGEALIAEMKAGADNG